MSKSKRNKHTRVPVSPGNYIRKRARNLPIVKCMINKSWEKIGLANIFIVRRHASGNFTICAYLVDKDCLGVKDTAFRHNVSQDDVDEYTAQYLGMSDMEEVSYELVHNVIFAALEYADRYGFKPHRVFTSVTRYFLEEDDDRIPLIHIRCGRNDGTPRYVNNGREDAAQSKKIIRQLEKTAGKGNFGVLLGEKVLADFDLREDEDPTGYGRAEYYCERILSMDDESVENEMNKVFAEYSSKIVAGSCEDSYLALRANVLAEMWRNAGNRLDRALSDEYLKMMEEDLIGINTVELNAVPNSLFPTFTTGGQELERDFIATFTMLYDQEHDKGDVEKQIRRFEANHGDCGALCYFKVMYYNDFTVYARREIERKLERFPDYFLVRLLLADVEITRSSINASTKPSKPDIRRKLMELVAGESVTRFEMMQFIMCYMARLFDILNSRTDDHLEKADAMYRIITGGAVINYLDLTFDMLTAFAETTLTNATIDRFFTSKSI